MPTVYLLIGVPGSGKTTWIANQHFDPKRTVITNTDLYLEQYATDHGLTFRQAIKQYIHQAGDLMYADVKRAFDNNLDLVWDQANITPNCRSGKFDQIPAHYRKVGIAFPFPPDEELKRRLASRPNKDIPFEYVDKMRSAFKLPTIDEGFDEIKIIQ